LGDNADMRMKRPAAVRTVAAATLAGALAFATAVASAAVRPPRLAYQIATLPNGLTIVLEEDHSTPIVHLQLTYHVGSKNEKPGRTGFAHLFEHLMFKGSKNVDAEGHTSMIASVGGQSNAYTTDDETVFWETAPSQYLPLMLWLEADRMATLRIDKDSFANEREVVKEERRLRIDNQPYGRLNEIIYEQTFTTHPYKHPTIGSMADLEAASVADVRDFYNTFYVPENATLTLVGDIDSTQALQLEVARITPRAEGGEAGAEGHSKEPPQTAERRVTLQTPGRCRRWWWRITSPTTATPTRIRCTSPARCCRMVRVRASTRSWSTTRRWRWPRSAGRISSRIRTCFTPSRSCRLAVRRPRRPMRSSPNSSG
jgi:zinc protease